MTKKTETPAEEPVEQPPVLVQLAETEPPVEPAPEPVVVKPATAAEPETVTIQMVHIFWGYNGVLSNYQAILPGEYSVSEQYFLDHPKVLPFLVGNQAALVRDIVLRK